MVNFSSSKIPHVYKFDNTSGNNTFNFDDSSDDNISNIYNFDDSSDDNIDSIYNFDDSPENNINYHHNLHKRNRSEFSEKEPLDLKKKCIQILPAPARQIPQNAALHTANTTGFKKIEYITRNILTQVPRMSNPEQHPDSPLNTLYPNIQQNLFHSYNPQSPSLEFPVRESCDHDQDPLSPPNIHIQPVHVHNRNLIIHTRTAPNSVIIYYQNGSTYQGEAKYAGQACLRHGYGIFTNKHGYEYHGQWSENKKNGLGKEKSADGQKYTVQYKNDKLWSIAVDC